ncbi:MAG: metal-dependent hydrolase [Patescibacteria group bacterium]
MKGSTHAVIGANTVWVLALFSGFSWNPFLILVGALGGLLPDLDASDSKIKHLEVGYGKGKNRIALKPFYLISWIVSSVFKHRGAFHSLLAVILVGWGSFFLFLFLGQWVEILSHEFWLVLTLGYASHIIADGMTHHGVPLLWPWKWNFHFLPKPFRIKTGGITERILYVVLLLILALFVLNSYASMQI